MSPGLSAESSLHGLWGPNKKKKRGFATRVTKSVGTPSFEGITTVNLGDELGIIDLKPATRVAKSKSKYKYVCILYIYVYKREFQKEGII